MGWVDDFVEGFAVPLIGGFVIGLVRRRTAARRARSQGLAPEDVPRTVRAVESLSESSIPEDPLDVPFYLDEIAHRRKTILNPARWFRRPMPLFTLICLGLGLTGPTSRSGVALLAMAATLFLAQVSGAATWVRVRRLDNLERRCRKKFGTD